MLSETTDDRVLGLRTLVANLAIVQHHSAQHIRVMATEYSRHVCDPPLDDAVIDETVTHFLLKETPAERVPEPPVVFDDDLPPIEVAAERGILDVDLEAQFITPEKPASGRLQIRPAAEVSQKPEHTEWLMRPYLERNVLALMYGELGTLKSFTALEFGLAVASGETSRAFPDAVVRGGNVIYISAEGKGLWRRLRGWGIARGIALEDVKLWAIEHPLDLSNEDTLLELAEAIQALGIEPDLVIVDTLSRNCGPADENKTADMTGFLNGLEKMIRVPFGCTVLLVHHVGHMEKGRARGSYVLMANTDANYLVERPDKDRLFIEMKTGRLKDSESPPTIGIEARVVELGTVDEDGKDETTLVLFTTSERAPKKAAAATGKNQIAALKVITKALETNSALLEADAVRIVREAHPEIPRNRAHEAVLGLINGGFLRKGPMATLEIP